MKAPLVREGSKENGTQVTGNQIYKGCLVCKQSLLGQAPIPWTIADSLGSASEYASKRENSARLLGAVYRCCHL